VTEYYSNAEWPEGTYSNMYGKPISSDKNESYNSAFQMCVSLEKEGFGGDRKLFPIRTWVSKEAGGEPIRPVLSVDTDGQKVANPPETIDTEVPTPLTVQELREAADNKAFNSFMSVVDQSMHPFPRELNSGWMMDDPLSHRRSKPIRYVPEFKGKTYIAPEKSLTKRDRQRLKKKAKKNKSY